MEQMIKPPQITYSSPPPSAPLAPSTLKIHHHHHQTNQAKFYCTRTLTLALTLALRFICSDDLDGFLAHSVLVNNIGVWRAITLSSSDHQSGWPGVEELDDWRDPLSSSSNTGAPTTTTMGFNSKTVKSLLGFNSEETQ
ncbi:hypothetical protein BY996DRAFT_6602139 [Phakopsora pachyrhizi]|nr:hypothetical protein BY996DRAFT_6602139 [Phakopsora pachyrhizi]